MNLDACRNFSDAGGPKFKVILRAREVIPEGSEVTISYFPSVLGNHKRRRRIESEWHFKCRCKRCLDPTECGTFVSGIVCEAECTEGAEDRDGTERNQAGIMLPKNPSDFYSGKDQSLLENESRISLRGILRIKQSVGTHF